MDHNLIIFRSLLLLFSCNFGVANPTNALPASSNARIVGGVEIPIHNAPWQASVQVNGNHECGGAIYSRDIIITAAHCVQGKPVTQLRVRVGSIKHNTGGTVYQIAAYKVHEQYDVKRQYYDIVLVRLATQITYGLSVKAIGLIGTSPTGGSLVSVTGWGYTESNGATGFADNLQVVQLQIIERGECASAKYGYGWDFVGEEMICAASAKKDSCTGDSGGPMVSDRLLAGIVAWGYGCAEPNYPGVYVDVAKLRSWIVKTANTV